MKTPNIIVFADSITSACSYWRAIGPMSELQRLGKINFTPTEYVIPSFKWDTLRSYDIAFMQRPLAKGVYDQVLHCKDNKCKLIIDLDDHQMISPYHPVYNAFCELYDEKTFQKIMMLADVVTVSTKELQAHYLQYSNNVVVVPNAINDYWLDFRKFSNNKTVIIRAGDHHLTDIWDYKDEIIEVLQNHKDWKLYVMGGVVDFLKNKIDNMEFIPDLNIHKYFAFILKYNPGIFIVPLTDNKLNRGKSNISWQEATLVGSVALTPHYWKLNKYSQTYADKKTFKSSFEKLITDSDLRKSLYEKSIEKVKKYYLLSKVNNKRMEIIKNLMK